MTFGIVYPIFQYRRYGNRWTCKTWSTQSWPYPCWEHWPTLPCALRDWWEKVALQRDDPDPGENYPAWEERRRRLGDGSFP